MNTKGLVMGVVLAVGVLGCGKTGPAGPAGAPGEQGVQGPQGDTGANGLSPILEIVDPCGDAPGIVDEILIRLNDGRVLCSFSDQANGKNTRLSILPAGNFVTTDGSNCHFTVNADGSIQ